MSVALVQNEASKGRWCAGLTSPLTSTLALSDFESFDGLNSNYPTTRIQGRRIPTAALSTRERLANGGDYTLKLLCERSSRSHYYVDCIRLLYPSRLGLSATKVVRFLSADKARRPRSSGRSTRHFVLHNPQYCSARDSPAIGLGIKIRSVTLRPA